MNDTRRSALGVVGVGVVAGILVALDGPEPVGANRLSQLLVVAAVAAACVIGAAARRQFLAWIVLIAGVSSLWLPGIVIGFVVFAAVYVLGTGRFATLDPGSPSAPVLHAVLAGAAINLSARSELGWFLGASTVIAVAIGGAIVVGGLLERSTTAVRATLFVSAGLLVLAIGASVAFGLVGLGAADELSEGQDLVRSGMRLLGDADLDGANAVLQEANRKFASAQDRLNSPFGVAAAAVPVVAQHREAALTLGEEAADLTLLVSDLLDDLGPDSLAFVDSRVDLDTVAEFDAALEEIQGSLDRLDSELERVSSSWLVAPLQLRLDDLGAEIAEQRARADTATDVVTQLPALLGAEERRTYLMVFTTPAEARGLGGFTGNWAEIVVDDGKVMLSEFGRSDQLDGAAPAGARTISGPTDWLQRYGPFGFTNAPGGTVGESPFKNITMSPLMSSTGQVIAELYPQSGGRTVDAVFAADVYVLADLLAFTGPVEVGGSDIRLDADNAAEFLLNTQYELTDKDERVDLIDDISRTVVDRLLGGARLEPSELLRTLGPRAEQGRLAGWAVREAEQDLLEEIGLAGSLLPLHTDDAVTVAFNNAAGSKIDYFLEASGRYEATVDSAGFVDGFFEITVHNTAPADGQPRYVIGNLVDLPVGSNLTYLSLFTALPATDLTIDGVSAAGDSGVEGGYFVTSTLVSLAPGERRTVRIQVTGPFDTTDGYSLVVRSPPVVGSTPIDVRLDVVDGAEPRIVEGTVEIPGAERIDITLDEAGGSS